MCSGSVTHRFSATTHPTILLNKPQRTRRNTEKSVGCVEVAEIGALQASRASPRIYPWMPRNERTVFQQPRTLRYWQSILPKLQILDLPRLWFSNEQQGVHVLFI